MIPSTTSVIISANLPNVLVMKVFLSIQSPNFVTKTATLPRISPRDVPNNPKTACKSFMPVVKVLLIPPCTTVHIDSKPSAIFLKFSEASLSVLRFSINSFTFSAIGPNLSAKSSIAFVIGSFFLIHSSNL